MVRTASSLTLIHNHSVKLTFRSKFWDTCFYSPVTTSFVTAKWILRRWWWFKREKLRWCAVLCMSYVDTRHPRDWWLIRSEHQEKVLHFTLSLILTKTSKTIKLDSGGWERQRCSRGHGCAHCSEIIGHATTFPMRPPLYVGDPASGQWSDTFLGSTEAARWSVGGPWGSVGVPYPRERRQWLHGHHIYIATSTRMSFTAQM